MKKIMAMVISVVMLLTMAVAMPVSADDEVNLIVNGSFEEVDQDGALVGWTQVNSANPMIRYENGTTEINGTPVSNATDGTYFVYNNKVVAGGAGLKQTVNFESDAAWVTNQAKYNFNLYFDYYWAYSTPWVDVKVTAYDAEGFTYSKTFVGDNGGWEMPSFNWAMATANVDVSSVIDMAPAPIVKLDIEILTQNKHEGSGYAFSCWDNVKLVPVYDADKTVAPMNLIRNGSFEMGEGSSITGWTNINEANPYVRYANGSMIPEIDAKNPISLATDGTYYIANKYYEDKGAGGLRQSVNLASGADWVTNQGKYKFNLTFSYYWAYNNPWCSVKVTAYGADNSYTTKTYVGGTDFTPNLNWNMNDATIDISSVISALESTVVKIDIELLTRAEAWTYGHNFFDNIKLIPEYDETKTKAENLLKNGTFEIFKANAAENEIYGWTQEGHTGTNLYFSQGVHEWWTSSNTAYYQVDTSSTSSVGIISQTVSFDESSPIYYNYPAYDFSLSMDVYLPSSYYKGRTELEVTGEDGTVATATIDYDFASSSTWNMNRFTYGIKSLVGDTIGDQPIKSIKVKLIGTGGVQMIAYDNVRLVPVYDESKKPVNLITNGHFGLTGKTGTDIPGWTQEGEFTNKFFEQGTALRIAVGNDPFASLASTAAVYTVNTEEAWAVGRLTQTVTFEETSDIYVNYAAYDFVLDMDVYVGSSSYKGWLELTVTGADDTVATQTVNYVYDSTKQWQMNRQNFNISELIADTIGVQPIKSIKIGLVGMGNNQCIAYDNVKLIPVKTADIAIVDGNGAEVNEIATAENATFTAKAKYSGSDAAAYSYIAVYSKDANGVIRLVGANAAPLTAGAENTSATLQNINTTAGVTIVKAFIWGSDAVSVIGVTAE